ncbi:tannase/feruloyl esterase family alpha/beta hydrolase [Mesobacterium pallidum]|uniref:tannase/feruloyl esterase family alpha/beta hydrolase n=1 Tax=Mesobacterium pallidum TaxID=2872037 RepID=UPI001EE16AA2|nr:tannase/feruloyl esterase family alpha/beta hydrolase [Mesobacterium pallidum]
MIKHTGPLALLASVAAGPMMAAGAETCQAAMALDVAGVTLTEAVHAPQGDASPVDHCILRGMMDERTGMDGHPYAIRFELRLPDAWSGQFMHQFNGGADGEVRPALGAGTGTGTVPALARGFAVVSSDAGHQGDARPDMGLASGTAFGFDFEARRDYGYDAVATLHPAALALTESYYGAAPDYVYGYGNSNGGRHGMVALSRMPDAFDGILSGYPGFDLPRTGLQSALDIQTFRSVGETLKDAFSREELNIVSNAVVAACDALDGLEDGVVADTHACATTFDPAAMICAEGQNSACLPEAKVQALITIHNGPVTEDGRQLYSTWYWDPGINSGSWRFWKLESPVPPWEFKPLIATLAAGAVMNIFSTPPFEVETGSPAELEEFMNSFDWRNGDTLINATTEDFPESAMQMIAAPHWNDPVLTEFQEAGGKLIVFHGSADPIFSLANIEAWHEKLMANNPDAATFERFYSVPGMPHGQGGNSADNFDMLGALVAWVEDGTAPDRVTAEFRSDNVEAAANAGATRPLCPWPGVARYTGSDPMTADSFTCE